MRQPCCVVCGTDTRVFDRDGHYCCLHCYRIDEDPIWDSSLTIDSPEHLTFEGANYTRILEDVTEINLEHRWDYYARMKNES